MDPVLLIGRCSYSHWVLGAHPGGIESHRPLSQLGVLPCDRGNMGGSPCLLRFVTAGVITLQLDWSPATGDGASTLITDGFGRGVVAVASMASRGGGERLQVTEATGNVSVLQAEASAPELRS
jgi:hypothetical protein